MTINTASIRRRHAVTLNMTALDL